VTLPHATVAILDAHRRRQLKDRMHLGLVFTTQSGQPCDWTNLASHYARICRRAKLGTFGIPVAKPEGQPGPRKQPRFTPLLPPYCLRHTHATLSLLAGVPVKVVSERLGHASTAFTMDVYADALPQMQGQAAEAWDKLHASFGT
jgi:integrase